jgi:hypothetical protein
VDLVLVVCGLDEDFNVRRIEPSELTPRRQGCDDEG